MYREESLVCTCTQITCRRTFFLTLCSSYKHLLLFPSTNIFTVIWKHAYIYIYSPFLLSPGSHPHARHHHGTPSSSSPETVRSHPIHYRAPSSPSEGYISLPYESFSAVQSGVTDSDADTRKHYGYYRRRGRPQLIWTPSDNCKYMC